MTKVYFRTADSKAFSFQSDGKVKYEKALSSINNKLKIPKEDIKLVYNGQTLTKDFKLNETIPHHIIHVINKRQKSTGDINVALTVNSGKGKGVVTVKNVKAKSGTTAKEFVNDFIKNHEGKLKANPENVELYHCGVKLADNATFQDHEIGNNANLNIMLQDYLDPADVPVCTSTLITTVNPIIMELSMLPKYLNLVNQINQVKNSLFFLNFQQRYEQIRPDYIYQDYGPYAHNDLPLTENVQDQSVPQE